MFIPGIFYLRGGKLPYYQLPFILLEELFHGVHALVVNPLFQAPVIWVKCSEFEEGVNGMIPDTSKGCILLFLGSIDKSGMVDVAWSSSSSNNLLSSLGSPIFVDSTCEVASKETSLGLAIFFFPNWSKFPLDSMTCL